MTTITLPEQADTPPATPGPLRRPWNRLIDAATNVALVAGLAIFAAGGVLPALTGGTAMTIMTGSMAPNLPPGHIVIYQPIDADSLEAGDVIAYQPDTDITRGIPITHRVIKVDSAGGHTTQVIVQGDANPVPDKPVKPGQIIGKMAYYIPFAGMLRVLAFHAGLDWLANALCIGLVVYGVSLWVRELWSGRRQAKDERAADRAGTVPTPHDDESAHVHG